MNNNLAGTAKWCENVMVVDADYIDKVAFDLIVNFERMIERRIPQADMARWIDCIALDGGLREGDAQTQVILIHGKSKDKLDNFKPSVYTDDLDGKAFKDNLGEFLISAYPVEDLVSKDDFFIETLEIVSSHKDVKRIMVVPDAERIYDNVRHSLRNVDEEKHVTVFAMQPMQGGNFRQEILGYSLMSALGIRADEIK
ncbi:DUF6621 family protein [Prevotella sp.]|uniref:DUF6621 family protein n=1 Tax=Prevotella sp. TaxID=59823 RepID=UPI002676C444